VKRERVGWIRYDGDEYHDFRYASPEDRHNLAQIERDYWPVYVDNPVEPDEDYVDAVRGWDAL
jgi:hypothetical protein